MLNPQNTNRVMKTYISPEMLAVEMEAQSMMMLSLKNKPANSTTVLTKRQMWDNDEDDDEW